MSHSRLIMPILKNWNSISIKILDDFERVVTEANRREKIFKNAVFPIDTLQSILSNADCNGIVFSHVVLDRRSNGKKYIKPSALAIGYNTEANDDASNITSAPYVSLMTNIKLDNTPRSNISIIKTNSQKNLQHTESCESLRQLMNDEYKGVISTLKRRNTKKECREFIGTFFHKEVLQKIFEQCERVNIKNIILVPVNIEFDEALTSDECTKGITFVLSPLDEKTPVTLEVKTDSAEAALPAFVIGVDSYPRGWKDFRFEGNDIDIVGIKGA